MVEVRLTEERTPRALPGGARRTASSRAGPRLEVYGDLLEDLAGAVEEPVDRRELLDVEPAHQRGTGVGPMIRLVHITDLHIGQHPEHYRPPTMLEGGGGAAGASVDSLRRLVEHASLEAISETEPRPRAVHCIVSGDLSRKGHPDSLSSAMRMIESSIEIGGQPLGLGYGRGGFSCVLGNHDIWGGRMLGWQGMLSEHGR